MFDPGGFQGRLRACPFLGPWRALLCWRFMLGLDEAAAIFGGSITGASTCRRVVPMNYLRRTYSGQFAGSSKLGRL